MIPSTNQRFIFLLKILFSLLDIKLLFNFLRSTNVYINRGKDD